MCCLYTRFKHFTIKNRKLQQQPQPLSIAQPLCLAQGHTLTRHVHCWAGDWMSVPHQGSASHRPKELDKIKCFTGRQHSHTGNEPRDVSACGLSLPPIDLPVILRG